MEQFTTRRNATKTHVAQALKGPRAAIPNNASRLARVVPLKRIRKQIIDEAGTDLIDNTLPDHVNPSNDDIELYAEKIKENPEIKLGGEPSVFATFASALNPSATPPRITLGVFRTYQKLGTQWNLDEYKNGEAAVLFEYAPADLPDPPGVRVPTIADAGYYPAFRPSPGNSPFGWTIDLKYVAVNPDSGVAGLPEVVHANVSAGVARVDYLILP